MKIIERNTNNIAAILLNDELRMAGGCIREVWNTLSDEKLYATIGVDGEYIYEMLVYTKNIIEHGASEIPSPSITFVIHKINNTECRVIMGTNDIAIYIACMDVALYMVPDREFQTIIGSYKVDVKELLDQFRKII